VAVHFVHVSKAGGTALRYAIRAARLTAGGQLVSPWGEVWGHDHRFHFSDVGPDDKAVLALRDPVSRFLSSYYSRLRKGAPRYLIEWNKGERQSFEWFPTPQALVDALAEPSGELRERGEFAMRSIHHVNRPMTHWTGKPSYLRKHIDKVLYVARQETLDDDWERLKDLLDLPRGQMLPHDPVDAHRTEYDRDVEISEKGLAALRSWYADDYELLEIGEEVRQGRVRPRPSRLKRLGSLARMSRS
jgi:Sulfotransferase family